MENDISQNKNEEIIISLIVENWRLTKLFQKVASKLAPSEQNRYINQLRYFQKTINNALKDINMSIVDLENKNYDPGMAVSPMNIDEFEADDNLVIDQVIEPLIIDRNGTIKKEGIVTLRKEKQ